MFEQALTAAAPGDCPGEAAYDALFRLWEKGAQRRPTTLEDYRRALTGFGHFVGWKALAEVGRRDLLAFRDHLLDRGLSRTTVTNRIGMLKSFFSIAVDYDWLPASPAERLALPRQAVQKARLAFSAEDMNRLFRSPIYTGALRPQSGGREAVYWLPLLALFTGARVEELAQLRVSDVRHAHGLGHYLDINDDGHGQLKNQASRRRIPLHRSLLDCGFLDYVASVRGHGGFIFPDLKVNPRGKRGGYFSNFFSGYLRQQAGITDRRKVFHSFRHTFKDACRSVGIDEEVHDALTGHTRASASRGYGNAHFPLPPLFDAIWRFSVEALDIAHLHVSLPPPATLTVTAPATVSTYYGIDVGLALEQALPQIVARYRCAEAHLRIDNGRIERGELPSAKLILVQAWMEIHRRALIANWENARRTGEVFPIAPLH